MNYTTHNDREIYTNGTSLKGYVNCDYVRLVELFGEPFQGGCDKVDWEWIVEFQDGIVATIYNWKNGPGYGYNVEPTEITRWHVGGYSEAAHAEVMMAAH